MKRFITALAICVLLVGAGTAAAVTFTWDDDAGGFSHSWGSEANWDKDRGVPDDSNDTAIIDDSSSPGGWPDLDQSRTIGYLTMHDGVVGDKTQIDTNGYTLTVTNDFTVSDTDSESYIEVLGGGAISVSGSFVISAAEENPATVKVTSGTISTS